MNKNKKTVVLSLDELRQQELDLYAEQDDQADFSELAAESELDFNAEIAREYEPEVWEVAEEIDNDDASDDTGSFD